MVKCDKRKPWEFACEYCGAWVGEEPVRGATRNACPECHWSKHVEFGTTSHPPCGGMMKPAEVGDGEILHRCLGCGFMMTMPSEAKLDAFLAQTPGVFRWSMEIEVHRDRHDDKAIIGDVILAKR